LIINTYRKKRLCFSDDSWKQLRRYLLESRLSVTNIRNASLNYFCGKTSITRIYSAFRCLKYALWNKSGQLSNRAGETVLTNYS